MKKLDRTIGIYEAATKAKELRCAFIMLGHGKFTLVDEEDWELLSENLWHFQLRGYATRLQRIPNIKRDVLIYMHRVIMNTPNGIQVDHINRNKLDNRKVNLRHCTQHGNSGNCGKRKGVHYSKYKGVTWAKDKKKWVAQANGYGKQRLLGRFDSEIEAALKYNEWSKSHFGEFGFINQI